MGGVLATLEIQSMGNFDMKPFAKRIAHLRIQRGLTQKEVANSLNVPLSTYKEWEYGRRIQGEDIYVRLAEILEIGLRELLVGQPENQKSEALEKIDFAIKQMQVARKSLVSFL